MIAYMGEGSYPKWGTHTVEIYLQDTDYKGTVIYQVSGNCLGSSILESAISGLEDGDFEPNMLLEENLKHIETDGDGYVRHFMLFRNNDEDTLLIDPEDIKDNVIGVRITAFVEDRE